MADRSSSESSSPSPPLVGVDVGGTFTDFVELVDGSLQVHKEATTPEQHRAVKHGLGALSVPDHAHIAHGTTVPTNALLERNGARTALLTTEGFADVLAIGRQNRPHLYRLSQTRPDPLVPADRRLEVRERLDASGSVLTPIDEERVRAMAAQLRDTEVESVAVVFLFSFQNDVHERRVAAILREELPGVPLSLSSVVLPEYREYERTATTVANAYVRPVTGRYLRQLDDVVAPRSVRVMQSSGGTIGLEEAAEEPARLMLSGPAGGVVGAFGVARQALDTDTPRVMTLDMGGTSTDVSLCDGAIPHTAEHAVGGIPLRLPATDIHTVGSGGGSIARADTGGSLRVGPDSAGAEPGPVCYGRGGTQPTVTDAHLVLGRLHPDRFLGGKSEARLDAEAARKALATLGQHIGLSSEEAALGVVRIANATMERALRRVSVEQGHDPRAYTLVPFGGAGPLHACALAHALDIRRILIPPTPGVLSALGLLMADVVADTSRAILQSAETVQDEPEILRRPVRKMADEVRATLTAETAAEPSIEAVLDLRYAGQSYELGVPLDLPVTADHLDEAVSAFHTTHAQRYGHARSDEPVEIVTVRIRGTAPGAQPELPSEARVASDPSNARVGTQSIWFTADGPTDTPAYDRSRLRHGHRFSGPAIIYQYDTTIVVPEGWTVRTDAWRNLRLEQ